MISRFKLDDSNKLETKETITRSLEIADTYSGELIVDVIPLERIELDPENHREMTLTLEDAINGISKSDPEYEKKREDWRSLQSLASTIKEAQLINPIYVYRFGNKCRLIAGERRTLASAIAGKKEIIARISSKRPVGVNLKVLQWIENSERSDLNLSEKLDSIEAILEENKKEKKYRNPADLLMKVANMSKTTAYKYIGLIEDKSNLRDAIREGKVSSMKVALVVNSCKDESKKQLLLDEAIKTQSIDSVSRLSSRISEKRQTKVNVTKKKIKASMGKATPKVASTIVESLLSNNSVDENVRKSIASAYNTYDWSDIDSVEKGFKEILKILSKESSK